MLPLKAICSCIRGPQHRCLVPDWFDSPSNPVRDNSIEIVSGFWTSSIRLRRDQWPQQVVEHSRVPTSEVQISGFAAYGQRTTRPNTSVGLPMARAKLTREFAKARWSGTKSKLRTLAGYCVHRILPKQR